MKTTNYCHNSLAQIFGTDKYADVLKTKTPINPMLKSAIDKAFSEAKNKSTFKKLVKQYARLTASGIKECDYCQKLLNKF